MMSSLIEEDWEDGLTTEEWIQHLKELRDEQRRNGIGTE